MENNQKLNNEMAELNNRFGNEARLLLPSDIVDAMSKISLDICKDMSDERADASRDMFILLLSAKISAELVRKLFK